MSLQGNILVLTSWSYRDALVQTYTLPYLKIIREILPADFKIILVTEEQPAMGLSAPELEKINRQWAESNMQLKAFPYQFFGVHKIFSWIKQLAVLWRTVRREKISVIHAFCTPAGSVGYLLSRLSGKPLLIDSFEPHAESMMENGTWSRRSMAYRILSLLEKLQSRRAVYLIGTTSGMQHYAKEKFGGITGNFFVKPACVDLEKFSLRTKSDQLLQKLGLNNKIVCVYAGKLGGIYLKEEVFDFIKACCNHWGDRFRFLLLTNTPEREIKELAEKINIPATSVICRFVFHEEIPAFLSLGDFALNPVKPVPSKRYCTSIKDGEYWAIGLPVIISPGISDDSEIIANEKTGAVLDFSNKKEYEKTIITIEELLANKNEMKGKIRQIAEKNRSFGIAEKIYRTIYRPA
jgi:glycosyltransferase involved in cell wall biosynthesis